MRKKINIFSLHLIVFNKRKNKLRKIVAILTWYIYKDQMKNINFEKKRLIQELQNHCIYQKKFAKN